MAFVLYLHNDLGLSDLAAGTYIGAWSMGLTLLTMVVGAVCDAIGEAIWSPRLMQFTAEIAPPGREGSYVALGYLPYFGAKFIAAPMSGWLVSTYTPEGAPNYPDHYMVWLWIGGTAILTPLGMLFFRKMYRKAEDDAQAAADAEASGVAGGED